MYPQLNFTGKVTTAVSVGLIAHGYGWFFNIRTCSILSAFVSHAGVMEYAETLGEFGCTADQARDLAKLVE